jgi:hypothetical protein
VLAVLPGTEERIQALLAQRGYDFYAPTRLTRRLIELERREYENAIATVVAKMIIRNPTARAAIDQAG